MNLEQIRLTTITGSITGDETLELEVDLNSTVHHIKLLAQDASSIGKDERLNPGMNAIKGVVPDFQRLFCGDDELQDDRTLKECRVKQSSILRFAVWKKMGIQLRTIMGRLREEPRDLSNESDCTVLSTVLDELKDRTQDRERHDGELRDKLYDLFDVDFDALPNVKDGCLTLTKGYNVEEESNFVFWEFFYVNCNPPPFKSCFCIPVVTTLYTMEPQHLVGPTQVL